MKHKIAVLVSVLFMVLTMTACGSGEPASAPSVADKDKAAVQEKLNKTESKSETTAVKADENSAESEAVTEAVTDTADTKTEPETDGTNILVAYFSRADENYNVGTIDKGNTQIVAEFIASEVGADSFHIETVTPYPADYDECCDVAKQEQADKARPEIQGGVVAVYTFMDTYDLSDKVVIPFNTHEGSGESGTYSAIANYIPDAQVLDGMPIQGKTAQEFNSDTQQSVREWLDGLGF